MTIYLDTSVLVAALTAETATPRIQQWLSDSVALDLAVSGWVVVEFSSALSLKMRDGRLDASMHERALTGFRLLANGSLTMLDIKGSHFTAAAGIADQHSSGLRAGDALHLAICADYGAAICTLDRRIGANALSFGVKPILL